MARMRSLVVHVLLYVSSYTPLIAIMIIRGTFGCYIYSWTAGAISGIALAALFLYFRGAQRRTSSRLGVVTVSRRNTEAMGYIVTYLVPFLNVELGSLSNAVSLLLLFVVIGVVYVNSNMIHTNPLLNVFGYHVYEVREGGGDSNILVTRRRYVRAGDQIPVCSVSNYVVMEKPCQK
jgi:hypothetical protein